MTCSAAPLNLLLVFVALTLWQKDAHAAEPIDWTRIRNEDVDWDGGYLGLIPHLNGYALQISPMIGKDHTRALMAMLDDKDRYIAAHVLLLQPSGSKYTSSSTEWAGVQVDILGDGSFEYPRDNRPAVKAFWQRKRNMSRFREMGQMTTCD